VKFFCELFVDDCPLTVENKQKALQKFCMGKGSKFDFGAAFHLSLPSSLPLPLPRTVLFKKRKEKRRRQERGRGGEEGDER
jgi:hypothetical protein